MWRVARIKHHNAKVVGDAQGAGLDSKGVGLSSLGASRFKLSFPPVQLGTQHLEIIFTGALDQQSGMI